MIQKTLLHDECAALAKRLEFEDPYEHAKALRAKDEAEIGIYSLCLPFSATAKSFICLPPQGENRTGFCAVLHASAGSYGFARCQGLEITFAPEETAAAMAALARASADFDKPPSYPFY